ncbi:MAG: hypothetical protein D3926_22770 [Desulfobacteraceae bacterium]|nr:MAG: hypothetical protein D3926_22770 [Desulfobacteraceae bacterium]
MKIKSILLILALPVVFMSCVVTKTSLFERAVDDAAVVEQSDVYDKLVAIKKGNESLVWDTQTDRVLVVMWKSRQSFEKFYKGKTATGTDTKYLTWVTTAPQVKQFAKDYLSKFPLAPKDEVDLRLKQYLGLKPEWTYDVFVEMWVAPEDLFRPCPDPEIDDTVCELAFPEKTPAVKGIDCYPCFYKDLYFNDFRTRPGTPWTGLGYTYDWGSRESPFGASEFIMIPGAAYEIERVVDTMDYIKEKELKPKKYTKLKRRNPNATDLCTRLERHQYGYLRRSSPSIVQ